MRIAPNTYNNALTFKRRNKNIINLDKLNKTPMSRKAKMKLTGLIATAAISIGSIGANKNLQANLNKYLTGNVQTQSTLSSIGSKSRSEKLEFAQKQIGRAIKRCEALQDGIWDNYTQIHAKTKELNGWLDYRYHTHLDYDNLYSSEYATITGINTGAKPWENIHTDKEVIEFLNSILNEASSHTNGSHIEITGGANITKGELELINKTLDELDETNPDTKGITKIYKKELKKAKNRTKKESTRANFNRKFTDDSEEAQDFRREILQNIDKIDAQSKKIKAAKKAYELKKDELAKKDSLTPREAVDFIVAYQDYLHANTEMLSICNLNPNSKTLNPSTAISGLDTNLAMKKIQHKLDKIL